MNKAAIITGSHKKNSQSAKVGNYMLQRLTDKDAASGCEAQMLNLADLSLPFWDDEFPAGSERWVGIWKDLSAVLEAADSLIIITPEWGGMVPPMLKNFFLLCNNNEIAHKPALIVSVSSGLIGGSYPVAELRSSSYKNTKVCYLPEQVIIKEVNGYLNDYNIPGSQADADIRTRIDYCLKILLIYSEAFKQIRKEKNILFDERYLYGM